MKATLLSFVMAEYCIRLASPLSCAATIQLLLPRKDVGEFLSVLEPTVSFEPFEHPRLRQPLRQIQMTRTLIQSIRRFDPDVIHLQQGHLWFNLALPLLRRYPIVLTIHDPRYHIGDKESQKTPWQIMQFGFHRAARFIVHTQYVKQVAVRESHIPEERVHVIPMVALGDVEGQSLYQEDDGLILFFGRIWPYKGLEYLIRAEPLISREVPNAKFVIAGEGEDFSHYRRLMIHPDRFVVYDEHEYNSRRGELFGQASVVVLPYIDASQSAVIPIAYSFARPVVATTVGGLPEMVDEGETGYLVPPRDERALADAIVRLLKDPPRRHAMGANGRRKSETVYSPDAVAAQTLAVYQSAINGRVGRLK